MGCVDAVRVVHVFVLIRLVSGWQLRVACYKSAYWVLMPRVGLCGRVLGLRGACYVLVATCRVSVPRVGSFGRVSCQPLRGD